jgi:serine/threonine protein kinase
LNVDSDLRRDLKPDNVGIALDGTAKLFDFGLCRDLSLKEDVVLSHHNIMKREPIYRMSTVGTRRYMSPEMISGHGYNQKTDSYSWAMVFYEMLSLQKPYAKYNRDMHKILVCEQQGRPLPSMDIPWSARDLLKRSWANDISDRPTMKEICDELEKMIDTVAQQTLPLIERSLRAVLEMTELFGFGNEKALPCIASGVIPCNDDDDSDIICSSYSPRKESGTELSVSAASRSVIAIENRSLNLLLY